MKAEYCVDYLSHQWNTDDLIATYRETFKQRQKFIVDNATTTTCFLLKNENRLKKSEEYKLKRFQNALWRNMARNCTNHLGKTNELINPATVSWQKESDITWLYGPMYTNSNKKKNNYDTQSPLQGLKPVLKKQSNVTQSLPSYSEPSILFYSIDTTTTTTFTSTTTASVWSEYGDSSVTTSGLCSSRSSFSSVCSKSSNHSIGVHFNPEIIEIEYQPEYPVSLESSPQSFAYYQEQEEEEEDTLWPLLIQASESLKASTYTRISSLFSKCLYFYTQQQQKHHHSSSSSSPTRYSSSSNNNNSLQLFILMVSMMKSVVSLTTTWLLYQSLSPLSSWLSVTAKPTVSNAAGQSSKQSRKARLIL
ncbi:hypothetical protein BDF21DRAFT_415694 [Thamnidium elegans]|nr:hypothetical protein BDF21DRAFT_415694 [Thamnidium elegans]